MTKFAYTSDIHFMVRGPRYRKDDFPQTIIKKMEFLAELAVKEKCSAIVLGGDLMDQPKISYFWLDKFFTPLRDTGLPILVLPGNHDLEKSMASIDRVPLGHYSRVGWINLLNEDIPFMVGDIAFWGIPYSYYEEAPPTDILIKEPLKDFFNVICTHHLYVESPRPIVYRDKDGNETPLYRLVSDCITNGDLVLLAHEHTKKEGKTKNGVTCFMPGSPTRLELTEKDKKRYFSVIEVDKNKKSKISCVEIPITPGDLIFDVERKEEDSSHKEAMESFIESIQKLNISVQSDSTTTNIRLLAKEIGVEQDVIDEAIRIIDEIQSSRK